ncbi:unnamed protein product [Paramecium sonneborni]|uniref:VWFA domain-containing protein n=1 Tax=Paramecium sonneborni TaxID=65129 RepID=A0A8S1KRX6_9CILI|nr:unnamed protein product [Paramecium sonneborni]
MDIQDKHKVNSILSKSPLTITKQEFHQVSELILEYKLNGFVMVLLRMQEYYLYFDIPLSIKHNIDLLSYMDQERINFFELIGYTYFNYGTYLNFYQNLVLFKYKQITRLTQQNSILLHKVIGDIVASVWWHYEFFKQTTHCLFGNQYCKLVKIIQNEQNGKNEQMNLQEYSKLSKYFQLIISNSLSYNLNETQLSQDADEFIQILLKKDELKFLDILIYIQQTSSISLKKRLIYYKLLFYYWLISKQSQLSRETQQKQKTILSKSTIQYRNTQSQSTSRIFGNQQQSGIFCSSIMGSRIQSHLSSSSIRFKKTSNQIKQYLQENVINLEESLQDSELSIQFDQYNEHFQNLIEGLSIYEINNWSDLVDLSDQSIQILKSVLEIINIEKLVQAYSDKYISLKSYCLIINSTENFNQHVQFIDQLANKTQYYQFPNPTEQFYIFYDYIKTKPQIEQIEIIGLIGLRLQFTKSQVNTFYRCLQLEVQDHFTVTEAAIRLKSIQTTQNCLKNRDWLSQINQEDWLMLKGIVFQQCLIDIFYLIVQCCFEQQIYLNTWHIILKNLFQIIIVSQSKDILLHFFQFVISNEGDFSSFINLFLVTEPPKFQNTQFQDVLNFVERILILENLNKKINILKGFQVVYPFPQIFYIDFIINNISESSNSLISYIKIKYNQHNEELLSQICFILHQSDQEFYSKFISPEDTPGLDLQFQVESQLSQQQALLFHQKIVKQLNLPLKEDVINSIQNYLNPLKGNCKSVIKELDQNIFIHQIREIQDQQILEYVLNHKQYIEKSVDKKVSYAKFRIQKKLQQIDNLIDKYQKYLLSVKQINKKMKFPQRSKYYVKQEYHNLIEPDSLIYIILNEILLVQRNILSYNLINSDYQEIFVIPKVDNDGDKSLNDSQINEGSQRKLIQEIIQYYIKIGETEKIPILKNFLEQLESEMNKYFQELKQFKEDIIIKDLDDQINEFRKIQIGCAEQCPFCGRKCDQNVLKKHRHKCSTGHQIRSMKGILIDNKLSLLTCEEWQDDYNIFVQQDKQLKKWKDLKLKYKNWNFCNYKDNQDLSIHQLNYQNYWNNRVGKIICNFLNCRFFPKMINEFNFFHHYIFVIDESGSMAGQKWKIMLEVYEQCFTELQKIPNNRITVIQFSDDARFIIGHDQPEKIQTSELVRQFNMMSGGTNFENAFLLLFYAIQKFIAEFDFQTILFYTDGDADFPKISMDLFSQIQQELRQKIDILICSEVQESKSLQKVCNIFQQKMGKGMIKENVSIEQLGKILNEKICQKY